MFFDKKIMLFNQDVEGSKEIITLLANELEKQRMVKNDFLTHTLERETKFPTGLETRGLGVAIPHTDSRYVNESQIAFATLKRPVNFKSMVDLDKNVSVSLVFMIAMSRPHEQAGLLSKLMGLFQNPEELEKLRICKTKDEVVKILQKHQIN